MVKVIFHCAMCQIMLFNHILEYCTGKDQICTSISKPKKSITFKLLHHLYKTSNCPKNPGTIDINKQDCIPVGCIPPACWPYLLARGGAWSRGVPGWGMSARGGGGGIPACTEADPLCEQNSWHTLLKILPCSKLRLRAVNTSVDNDFSSAVNIIHSTKNHNILSQKSRKFW